MDDHGASEFEQFLVGAWSDGRFLEFRVDGRLLGVAVTDRVERALSAVYTFYDPDESARGLAPSRSCGRSRGRATRAWTTCTWATGSRATARWITERKSTRLNS